MLVPAYAATIHKSQGSEYPAVVIPVLTQHYAMLQRKFLYTGVTRGKRLVVLLGQKKAVAIAVRNVSGRRRWVETERMAASFCETARNLLLIVCPDALMLWGKVLVVGDVINTRSTERGTCSFQGGITPARIARQFGLSQSDVRKALTTGASKGGSIG